MIVELRDLLGSLMEQPTSKNKKMYSKTFLINHPYILKEVYNFLLK